MLSSKYPAWLIVFGLAATACVLPGMDIVESLPSSGGATSEGTGAATAGGSGGSGAMRASSGGTDGGSAGVGMDDPSAPSCQGLTPNCGLMPNQESCCTTLWVEGGDFVRSNLAEYPATVSSFYLDKFEVTVGRFRKFVQAVVGGWLPVESAGKHEHLNGGDGLAALPGSGFEPGWDPAWNEHLPSNESGWTESLLCFPGYETWTPDVGSHERRPINCVSWYQAYAFCIWDGGFLPSEAEWNYAAVGGDLQRKYPWGNEPEPGNDAELSVHGCWHNREEGAPGCTGIWNIALVGSVPDGNGHYGHADLSGNLWEWTLDWNREESDPDNVFVMPCEDCVEVLSTDLRKGRGAGFRDATVNLDLRYNTEWEAVRRSNIFGLRCARSPDGAEAQ